MTYLSASIRYSPPSARVDGVDRSSLTTLCAATHLRASTPLNIAGTSSSRFTATPSVVRVGYSVSQADESAKLPCRALHRARADRGESEKQRRREPVLDAIE